MGRAPCCDKANVKKGPWSPEEDATLKSFIDQNGTGGNWIALPQKIGLKRCGKSCRLRWLNYLRPNIKHGEFSEEEDNIICSLYISIGSRWSIIAAQLPGRTDNDIKNYWNTRLKKKLLGKQRKEVQARRDQTSQKQQQEIMKKKIIENYETSIVFPDYNNINQNPYWPEQPVLPPIPYSNQEPRFNNHTSFRKLLMNLGGKFSDNDHDHHNINNIDAISNTQVPSINTSVQPCPNPLNNVSPNIVQCNMFDQGSTFPGEFMEEMLYNVPERRDGLEFLYGDTRFGSSSTTDGESAGMDWGEMSTLVYTPLPIISSCDESCIQQGTVLTKGRFEAKQ